MSDAPVVGVVLAGGLSRRMGGGDKCLRSLAGRPILAHILERLRPQVARLMLNANGDPARFAAFGVPVAADIVEGFPGPLAGVLTGMRWAQANCPGAKWLVSAAADAPFMPTDLVARMRAGADAVGAGLACARSGGQAHPVFGLWRIGLADDLAHAVCGEGVRKVDLWTARHGCIEVDFPIAGIDPFFNVNRPEDLAEAERMIATAP
jgi:molybdenum cofactor guanylyltransferase